MWRSPASRAAGELDWPAFGEFYDRVAPVLYSYLLHRTGVHEDAQDILQDAFMRLLTSRPPSLEHARLKGYLFRIATNLVTDAHRRSLRDHKLAESVGGEERIEPQSADLDLTRAFARLSPREQTLLWLAHVEGENHRVIAEALDVNVLSVRVLLFRARRKLAKLLSPGEP